MIFYEKTKSETLLFELVEFELLDGLTLELVFVDDRRVAV